jgi:hypothetical protein
MSSLQNSQTLSAQKISGYDLFKKNKSEYFRNTSIDPKNQISNIDAMWQQLPQHYLVIWNKAANELNNMRTPMDACGSTSKMGGN